MTQLANGETSTRILVVVGTVFAAALPLYILLFNAPLSHPDLAQFAKLHLRSDFWPRAVLTFVYFPAVLVVHFLAAPRETRLGALFTAGFLMFAIGNAIDATYRSVQFLTVHGIWAEQLLGGAPADAAVSKITAFNELAPAITAAFSALFAAGRGLMGLALLLSKGRLVQGAGLMLLLNGVWNLATVLSQTALFVFLSALGAFYLWIWLASSLAVGLASYRQIAQQD